jgi:phosphoserine phosphatase
MVRFLVILDVDSTLIENEVIELLAGHAGSLEEVELITARAMNGEIDFEACPSRSSRRWAPRLRSRRECRS